MLPLTNHLHDVKPEEPREVVVFEGPSGSGKSTIIRALMNTYPGAYDLKPRYNYTEDTRSLPTQKMPIQGDVTRLIDVLYDPTKTAIFDRFWFNGVVYAPMAYAVGQGDRTTPRVGDVEKSVDNFRVFYRALTNMLEERDRPFQYGVPDLVMKVFICRPPSLVELQRRQMGAHREYPYDTRTDWNNWQFFLDRLRDFMPGRLTTIYPMEGKGYVLHSRGLTLAFYNFITWAGDGELKKAVQAIHDLRGSL